MNAIIAILKSVLPVLRMIAGFTKTDIDDKIVALLEKLVADPAGAVAELESKGAI